MNTSTLIETVNINLEDFSETFLTCSTCLYTYDQNDALSLRCPMCREVCVLPAGGVHALPAAFLINQLLDVMQGRLRALDQAHVCVSQEIEQLDKNVDKIVDQINGTFQEVSNTVENRRRDLIESVRVRRDEKRKVLKDQIEAITDEKKKLAKMAVACRTSSACQGGNEWGSCASCSRYWKRKRGRIMVSTCAVCPESGLVIAGVVDAKTNKAQLA
ncbi:hypothetical protein TELCIR_10871, partial [Teladorsagia circumcincta]